MDYQDRHKADSDKQDDQHRAKKREDQRDEDRWDSQDDSDYRYTDWASI